MSMRDCVSPIETPSLETSLEDFSNLLSSISCIQVQVSVSDDVLQSLRLKDCQQFIELLLPHSSVLCTDQVLLLDNTPVTLGHIKLRFSPASDALCSLPRAEAIKSIIQAQASVLPSPPPSSSTTPTRIQSSLSSALPPFSPDADPSCHHFYTPWAENLFQHLLSLSPSTSSTIGNGDGDGLPVVALNCCSLSSPDPIAWFASKFSSSPAASIYVLFDLAPSPPAPRQDSAGNQYDDRASQMRNIKAQMIQTLGEDKCLDASSLSSATLSNIMKRLASLGAKVCISKISDYSDSTEHVSKSKRWLKSLMKTDIATNQLLAEKESILGDLLLQLGLYNQAVSYLKSALSLRKSLNEGFSCGAVCEGIAKAYFLNGSRGFGGKGWGKRFSGECYDEGFQNDLVCRWLIVKVAFTVSFLILSQSNNQNRLSEAVTVLLGTSNLLSRVKKESPDYLLVLLTCAVLNEVISKNFEKFQKPRSALLYKKLSCDYWLLLAQNGQKSLLIASHVLRIVYFELFQDSSPTATATSQLIKTAISACKLLDRHGDLVVLAGHELNSADRSRPISQQYLHLIYNCLNFLHESSLHFGRTYSNPLRFIKIPVLEKVSRRSFNELSSGCLPPPLVSSLTSSVQSSFCFNDDSPSCYSVGEEVLFEVVVSNPTETNLIVTEVFLNISIDSSQTTCCHRVYPLEGRLQSELNQGSISVELINFDCSEVVIESLQEFKFSVKIFTSKTTSMKITSVVFGVAPQFHKSKLPILFIEHLVDHFLNFNKILPLLSLTINDFPKSFISGQICPFSLSVTNSGQVDASNVGVWISDPGLVCVVLSDEQEVLGIQGSERHLHVADGLPINHPRSIKCDCQFEIHSLSTNSQIISNILPSNIHSPSKLIPSIVIPCLPANSSLKFQCFLYSCSPINHDVEVGFVTGSMSCASPVFSTFASGKCLIGPSISCQSYASDFDPSARDVFVNVNNNHCSEVFVSGINLFAKSNFLVNSTLNSKISPKSKVQVYTRAQTVNSGVFTPKNLKNSNTKKILHSWIGDNLSSIDIFYPLTYFISFNLLINLVHGFHPRSPPPPVLSNTTFASISPNAAFEAQQALEKKQRDLCFQLMEWPWNKGCICVSWKVGESQGFSWKYDVPLIDFDRVFVNYEFIGDCLVGQKSVLRLCFFNTFSNTLKFHLQLTNSDAFHWESMRISNYLPPFLNFSIDIPIVFHHEGVVELPTLAINLTNGETVKLSRIVTTIMSPL
ncbi:hypothetical protein GEMRC1_013503 [Eukaryota sp. GEM-RC1]